jgi:hypothetical protein
MRKADIDLLAIAPSTNSARWAPLRRVNVVRRSHDERYGSDTCFTKSIEEDFLCGRI